ncbi:MAG: molybdate ABC transporter substrate-binding protein [Candidatus Thiodiazotropha sp. (ex Myrtea sp. 'scaly one' KF741663)]|nr:molybdate ABC transporter substrate-binding protein [Candidatus Thiodiazotropha sp. (ex Myrtea sp. 'scaly one' KF741663)]
MRYSTRCRQIVRKPARLIDGITLLCLMLLSSQVTAAEVVIAVAANFTDATRQIAPLFEKATGHTTRISYGSTGKLYSQIEHGAPFEVFLAADTQRPIKAEAEGLAVPGSRFIYARGKLALWSKTTGLFDSGEDYLKSGKFKHLAAGNAKTAPYGLAARQVMTHLGLFSRLEPKLVRGESIAQTFQFVATGNAKAGFVAYSQIKSWRGKSGSIWEIPLHYYTPIDQAAVLLKKGESNPAAHAFLAFLKSEAARKKIRELGYGVE